MQQRALRGRPKSQEIVVSPHVPQQQIELVTSAVLWASASFDGSISESDAECPICGLTFLEDDSDSPWVCCDGCQSWLDFKCTRLKTPKRLPKEYFCNSCK